MFVSLRFGGHTPEAVLLKPKLGVSRARGRHPRAGLFDTEAGFLAIVSDFELGKTILSLAAGAYAFD